MNTPNHPDTRDDSLLACMLWVRLDEPGHDVATLHATASGFHLSGTAVFRAGAGPTSVTYQVQVDHDWRTKLGIVQASIGGRAVTHRIERDAVGWRFDGAARPQLRHLQDLDFGFTPATNVLQLRRMALQVGARTDWPVTWFDLDALDLQELPQRYTRETEFTYRYAAPTVPYEGTLVTTPNGFVAEYPGLWRAVVP